MDAVARQRAYYADSANAYDAAHLGDEEHEIALDFMLSSIRRHKFRSILDIGSGTGRAIIRTRSEFNGMRIVGVEPSSELREIAHLKGISRDEIIEGDAQSLQFPDDSFDLACAFGVLHHVPGPRDAVREMMRVAKRAIFISDANNFGQGSLDARSVKQALRALGLWKAANLIKTKGTGYTISAEDGLSYSYSVFDDYHQIAERCSQVHMLNTIGEGPNLYRTASHVALLGLLKT